MFQPDPYSGRTLEELTVWVETQYAKLANVLSEFEPDSIRFNVHHSEPDKPRQGHLYFADGSNWNPGSGEGFYFYDSNDTWTPVHGHSAQTWTPVLSDGTNDATSGAAVAGFYTQVGKRIDFIGRMYTTSLGSVSGDIRITGLPAAAQNVTNAHAAIYVGYGGGLAITADQVVGGFVAPSTDYISLTVWDATTGTTNMQHSEWSDDGDLIFGGTYFI